MARRQVTEMQYFTGEGLKGYEALWEHIKSFEARVFTVPDVEKLTNVRRDTVRDYVKRLLRAGYIEEAVNPYGPAKAYRLLKAPRHAPRLQRSGGTVTQGLGRQQLWRTIKMIGSFTSQDLAIAASTEEVTVAKGYADDYIKFLVRAGYLRVMKKSVTGVSTAVYRMIPGKYTGPDAPMIQRIKRVYDPNLKKVVWPIEEGGAS